MDAVAYLLSRRQPSLLKRSGLTGIVFIACLGAAYFVAWITETYPGLRSHDTLMFLGNLSLGMVLLVALGCLVKALVRGPFAAISGIQATLNSWSASRLLDEFTAAGLSERHLFDRLTAYYLREWIAKAALVAAAMCVVAASFDLTPGYWVLLYFLGFATLIVLSLARTAFHVTTGAKGVFLFLFCNAVLSLPWLIYLGLWERAGLPPRFIWVTTAYFVVLAILNRSLAVTVLERRGDLDSFFTFTKRRFSLKRKGGISNSDNAIVARYEKSFQGWSGIARWLIALITLGTAVTLAASENSPTVILFYLHFLYGLSGAGALYQLGSSVSKERDRGTLETLTSTPMGVEAFHRGWMRLGTRSRVVFNLLITAVALLLVEQFLGGILIQFGSLVNLVILAVLFPLLGGFIGLSVAAQPDSTRELDRQLVGASIALAVLSLIQLSVSAAWDSSWGPAVVNLIGMPAYCLFFYCGSKRSLSRLFEPQ